MLLSVAKFDQLNQDAQTEFILGQALRSLLLKKIMSLSETIAKKLLKEIMAGEVSEERLRKIRSAILLRLKTK